MKVNVFNEKNIRIAIENSPIIRLLGCFLIIMGFSVQLIDVLYTFVYNEINDNMYTNVYKGRSFAT
ncbi:hypothetical protein ACTHO5_00455 [Cytobacillus praedii]